MTTFYRGIPSVIEALLDHRNGLQNRLTNDDIRKGRGERTGTMRKMDRDVTQGEIQGLNYAVALLSGATILSPEEYDRKDASAIDRKLRT